jgi:hypothetical protein
MMAARFRSRSWLDKPLLGRPIIPGLSPGMLLGARHRGGVGVDVGGRAGQHDYMAAGRTQTMIAPANPNLVAIAFFVGFIALSLAITVARAGPDRRSVYTAGSGAPRCMHGARRRS